MKAEKSTYSQRETQDEQFERIRAINGSHPLKEQCPGSYVEYQVRHRKNASVVYFNFELAKEMGLVSQDHPLQVTSALEAALIEAFSIQIINEYDIINGTKINPDEIKPNRYMATRYLQLQHPSKTGLTSGDGRSLWNGYTKHKGRTWDITSCGTGATCLSPATALQKKFFRTGDPSVSYGCGYNDLHDGITNAVFSEVLYLNDILTERTLLVLGYPGDLCIVVRAGTNLLRPSHFFNHLRQNRYDRLKNVVDFFIDRQLKNGSWKIRSNENRYDLFLEESCKTFAKMAAKFEADYIFCWLDWDGDNILADGGIIDYGSIRQFGLFHHEYRYDDAQRWSTSIKEQRAKAKHILRTMAQMTHFLKTKDKKSLESFDSHSMLQRFESIFEEESRILLMQRLGFTKRQSEWLADHRLIEIEGFRRAFSYFERAMSSKGPKRTPDGISCDALFCMRDILRELPTLYLAGSEPVDPKLFMSIIKSNYATRREAKINSARTKRVERFQAHYRRLVAAVARHENRDRKALLNQMQERSNLINRYERITGNAVLEIGRRLMGVRKKLSSKQLHVLIKSFIHDQILIPERQAALKEMTTTRQIKAKRLSHAILRIVREYREGI